MCLIWKVAWVIGESGIMFPVLLDTASLKICPLCKTWVCVKQHERSCNRKQILLSNNTKLGFFVSFLMTSTPQYTFTVLSSNWQHPSNSLLGLVCCCSTKESQCSPCAANKGVFLQLGLNQPNWSYLKIMLKWQRVFAVVDWFCFYISLINVKILSFEPKR